MGAVVGAATLNAGHSMAPRATAGTSRLIKATDIATAPFWRLFGFTLAQSSRSIKITQGT